MNTALLISNVALVLVTGTYVFLTWSLSKASARAAEAATVSARASEKALELQEAALALQRARQQIAFKTHPAGPFDSGFGFTLTADGGSYFVRRVIVQNISFCPEAGSDPGYTLGGAWEVPPRRGKLPMQLDPADGLVFEGPAVESSARRYYGGQEVYVDWWDMVVECSFGEHDQVVRRVYVHSNPAMA